MYNPKILHESDSERFEIFVEGSGVWVVIAHCTFYPDKDELLVDNVYVDEYWNNNQQVTIHEMSKDILNCLWEEIDRHNWIVDF